MRSSAWSHSCSTLKRSCPPPTQHTPLTPPPPLSLHRLFKEGVSFPDWELYRREAWMVHVRLLQDAVGGVTEEAGDPQDAETRLPLTIQAALHAGGPPLREAIKEAVEGGEVEGSEADVAARVAALEESEYADPQWAEVHAGLIAELCGLLLTLGGELIGTEQWVSVWAPSFATLGASTKELQIPVYSSQHTAELLGPCASRVAWKCDATPHCSLAFSGFSVDHFRSLKKIADTERFFHLCRPCVAVLGNVGIGDRVVRRCADWEYGDIDGGLGGYGVVTHVFGATQHEDNIGHIRVHWDCDKAACDTLLRFGAGGFQDVAVLRFNRGTRVRLMPNVKRVAALLRAFGTPSGRLTVDATAPGVPGSAVQPQGDVDGQYAPLTVASPDGPLRNPAAYYGAHGAVSGFGPSIPLAFSPTLAEAAAPDEESLGVLVEKVGTVVDSGPVAVSKVPPAVQVAFDDVTEPVWLPAACLTFHVPPDWTQVQ